jgi:hypothetical protein
MMLTHSHSTAGERASDNTWHTPSPPHIHGTNKHIIISAGHFSAYQGRDPLAVSGWRLEQGSQPQRAAVMPVRVR